MVLVTFTALTLRPLEAVAQAPVRPAAPAAPASDDERFSRTLNDIHELLKELAPAQAMPEAFRLKQELEKRRTERSVRAIGPDIQITVEEPIVAPKVDFDAKLKALRGKFRELEHLEGAADRSFAAMERYLRQKNMPEEILARHQAAVAEYEARKAEFKRLAAAVEAAAEKGEGLSEPLAALGAFMAKYPNQRRHTPTDPDNLPWRSPKPIERKPATTREEFRKLGLFGEPVKVAQAGSLSRIALPTTQPPATPTPEDLAETEDVQITQAIRDLATSLGNNPVRIYNWVRNNIEFIPSYGSIQGSDLTLQTKRGNAFDTASLLIALLRAANIPARYVYGTIEVPAEQVMNWVGGVTVPEAAQNLMGQGGIPNLGVASGGKITTIRLEHVWVEAFVDWVPSRGAVHRQGDTWVPMDGSFKQYSYTQGMNIQQNVPFDAQNFLDAIRQGAEVNESEGWVRNVNQPLIQQTLVNYQNQLKAYVDAQEPDATAGEVLGTKAIVQESSAILAGALPYKMLVTGAKFATVPDNLRWKFRYDVYVSDVDRTNENPFVSMIRGTPEIGGKKITLSFGPATQADADLMRSYVPPPHRDGSPIQPSEIPTSLPGYLLRLVPELRVDETLVASATPGLPMGSQVVQSAAFFNPSTQLWVTAEDNRPTIGEFHAIVVDPQGLIPSQLQALRARIGDVKGRLGTIRENPSDPSPAVGLTRDRLTGDLLYGAAMGYFASIDSYATLAAHVSRQAVAYRLPSYGVAFLYATSRLLFGIPRSVSVAGLGLDIDLVVQQAEAINGDSKARQAFLNLVGMAGSAYEHSILEAVVADPSLPANDPRQPQGVSAIKLLSIAAAQGQRIFTLGPLNRPIHEATLATISLDSQAREEIANALSAGRQAIFHEDQLSFSGWSGAGYVILDSETGAGAYRISGGANGGWIIVALALAILLSVLFFEILAVYYATVLLEAFVTAAAFAISVLVDNYLTQLQVLQVAALFFVGAVLVVAAFLAAGYVTTFALFFAVLAAGGVFLWELLRTLWSYRPGPL